VDVYASKYGELSGFITAATSLWPDNLIATSNIISYIIDRLEKNGAKVTTAESCTGGLISTLLTKESGSSNVFDGGIVTYSNEKKIQWLGVEESILQEYGAVSEQTVLAMSRGAKEVAEADFALAVSGIAGPTGESDGKPVGLVYLALCSKERHESKRLLLSGDRNYIQMQAAYHAIKMLILSDKTIFFENRGNTLDKGGLV
jgi:nicotinamide-nucleotide amidase